MAERSEKSSESVPPSASQVTSERKMPIVPSVTMNASMRMLVMRKPLRRPDKSPAAIATPMPSRMIGRPTPIVGRA